MAPINILLLNVYFHREKEIITFSLGRNIIRLYFHSLETECSFWNFLFITYHTLYFKDDSFCFSVRTLWCHEIIILTILLMYYLKPTTPSFSKIKATFYRTAACHRTTTATDKKAAGCLQISFLHFYILNARYSSISFEKKKKSHGLISLSVYLFCIYNIKNIFLICHVLLHHWLFLWP